MFSLPIFFFNFYTETILCSQMLLLPLLPRWFCNIFTVMYMYKPDRWLMQAFLTDTLL